MDSCLRVIRTCNHSHNNSFCYYGINCKSNSEIIITITNNVSLIPKIIKYNEPNKNNGIFYQKEYCAHYGKDSQCPYGCGFKFNNKDEEIIFEKTGYFKHGYRKFKSYKNEKCEYFMKYGYCKYKNNCKFSHEHGTLKLNIPLLLVKICIELKQIPIDILLSDSYGLYDDDKYIKCKYSGILYTKRRE